MSTLILLTERQAADKLGLSDRTLQRWRETGYGPPFRKPGKSVRYVEFEIDDWINRKRYGSSSAYPGGSHSMGWIGLIR